MIKRGFCKANNCLCSLSDLIHTMTELCNVMSKWRKCVWIPDEASNVKRFCLENKTLKSLEGRNKLSYCRLIMLKMWNYFFVEEMWPIFNHESVQFPPAALLGGSKYKEQTRNWGNVTFLFLIFSRLFVSCWSSSWFPGLVDEASVPPSAPCVGSRTSTDDASAALCFNAGPHSRHRFTTHVTTLNSQ